MGPINFAHIMNNLIRPFLHIEGSYYPMRGGGHGAFHVFLAMGPTCWPTSGWDLGDLKVWLRPSYVQKIAPFNHPNYIIRGPHVQSILMDVQSIQVDSNGCKLVEHVYKGDEFFGPP